MYTRTSLVLVSVLALALVAASPAGTQYNSRFDSVDVDKILANPRVLANYVKCVTDKGPCTSEGKEIKKILPDVLATSCAKCTPKMKTNVRKVILALKDKHPNDWAALVNKYDPKKTHAKDLEAFLKS